MDGPSRRLVHLGINLLTRADNLYQAIPTPSQAALAVLSQRFGIDIPSGHPNALQHIDKAIMHHMRVHIATNPDGKWRHTTYPSEPFLSHVFLDLPRAHSHLANVAPVLRTDGILAIFNPSITQIAECVEEIRKRRMPYILDRVVELGIGTIREW